MGGFVCGRRTHERLLLCAGLRARLCPYVLHRVGDVDLSLDYTLVFDIRSADPKTQEEAQGRYRDRKKNAHSQ